ncbi:hypothetical protein [Mycobacterium branderi]|uniref:Uncharacterized protein n=1 Tax=Mycobacterium branderi TaxID=43348 RepID=A0A7I7WBY1_9MYCO|nr:hypothetical protein [Mycobacterium branderi]MCV7236221.1 hypothetical protein [Mycobacterium branderi]ORA35408.1 hypothetical protein BST20_17560 [Mycobacterium branderi]BBZ15099.1 hypothetical protein MBRA_52940 [Mycobacterium branderi]
MADRDAESVFFMNPQEVVWELARTLIRGQQTLATMRRTVESAKKVAAAAPAETQQVIDAFNEFERNWYEAALPSMVASFKLAVEVYDTFGPGDTRITDPVDAAIWNNKHHVWTAELGGTPTTE